MTEDETSELVEENRTLRRRFAAIRVGIWPAAADAAGELVDWTGVDQDVDIELEAAFKGLRDQHKYLFAASAVPGIDAGARNYEDRPPTRLPAITTTELLSAAYAELERDPYVEERRAAARRRHALRGLEV